MNPTKERELKRILRSSDACADQFRDFCDQQEEMVRQAAGFRYGKNDVNPTPVNLLELGRLTYLNQLITANPQIRCRTTQEGLERDAKLLELYVNKRARTMELYREFMHAVHSALYIWGVAKVGIDDEGEKYVDFVDTEDFVCDLGAKRWERCAWFRHRYTVPLEDIRENEAFDESWRNSLQPTHRRFTSEQGHRELRQISVGEGTDLDEYDAQVELYEFFTTREQLVFTMTPEGYSNGKAGRIVEWDGRPQGPFHKLQFGEVLGNIVGSGPMLHLVDLHDAGNRIWNKLIEQAERQKTLLLTDGAHAKDGRAVVDHDDGDAVAVNNPAAAKDVSFGGANQQNLGMGNILPDLFSMMGGNIFGVAGISAQADTLGQEQILDRNASMRLRDMQDRTDAFVKEVLLDIADDVWSDELLYDRVQREVVPGQHIDIPVRFGSIRGRIVDYDISVEPFSLRPRTPQDRLNGLLFMFERIIAQLMPSIQQRGGVFDAQAFIDIVAKEMGLEPEMKDMLIWMTSADQAPPAEGGGKPPVTERRYTRQSIPGASLQGNMRTLGRMALMGNAQEAEQAALGRRTG